MVNNKNYELWIDNYNTGYSKYITGGSLIDITAALYRYFRYEPFQVTPDDENHENYDELSALSILTDVTDLPNEFAGVLEYTLSWYIVTGVFRIYHNEKMIETSPLSF